jgi:NCS1 family nucleobase:cation symporter-1
MIIWAFAKVPASEGLFSQHATIGGSYFSWAWLSAMNSALGIYASLSVNIPDFTVGQMSVCCSQLLMGLQRYAKNERAYEISPESHAIV